MTIIWDNKKFEKDMHNIVQYSLGFMEGVEKGKTQFVEAFAQKTSEALKEFIDSMARTDPQMYHHIYEWYMTGSPKARLFRVKKIIVPGGFRLEYSFSQSKSIQNGSIEPFRDKAKIMEEGKPVVIKPTKSKVLVFMADNQEVFSSKPSIVNNPGGTQVKNAFHNVVELFFKNYFKQSFLRSSGIYEHLSKPVAFKNNFSSAATGGRSLGTKVGYTWIIMGALNV